MLKKFGALKHNSSGKLDLTMKITHIVMDFRGMLEKA